MNLRMHWIATTEFQGGRRSTTAITVLWSGTALSLMIAHLMLRQSLARQQVLRQVEQATTTLQAREAQTRSMLESTQEGIFGIDSSGLILFANHATARLLGYATPDDLLGLDCFSLLWHARQDGSITSDEDLFVRKDAGWFTRLLRRFAASAKRFPADFAAARQSDDFQAALRCVHTFQANAATLGVIRVEKIAAMLEDCCRNAGTDTDMNECLSRLGAELAIVLPALD